MRVHFGRAFPRARIHLSRPKCATTGCDRRAVTRDWCQTHYYGLWRRREIPLTRPWLGSITSSSLARPSRRPSENASLELVVAGALNPSAARTRAEPAPRIRDDEGSDGVQRLEGAALRSCLLMDTQHYLSLFAGCQAAGTRRASSARWRASN